MDLARPVRIPIYLIVALLEAGVSGYAGCWLVRLVMVYFPACSVSKNADLAMFSSEGDTETYIVSISAIECPAALNQGGMMAG